MFTVTQQVGRAAWWESASVSVLSRSALSSESVVLTLPFVHLCVHTVCVPSDRVAATASGTEFLSSWSSECGEEPDKHTGQPAWSWNAVQAGEAPAQARRGQVSLQEAGPAEPRRMSWSHAGWDAFSWMMGTAWAGLRGRAIVTCRSVILLPVTGSLLYTIKGLYSLRPLKSRVQGRLQEWLDWGIQHCLPGPIQLSPLLMSWQDVQYDPELITKGQTGQSKRTKIRSFTLDELSYLSIPGPVTGRGGERESSACQVQSEPVLEDKRVHLTQRTDLGLDGGAGGSWKGQLGTPLGSQHVSLS